MAELNGIKRIKLVVTDGPTLTADVVASGEATAWLTNARDAAWAACLHHGRPVEVLDPADGDAPVVRVSCEWLEGEEE